MLILAAVCYIVVLRFCSGKTIPIIHAYNCRLAFVRSKCRCRSDASGRNVFEIHGTCENRTCVLYVHHRHICAWPKNLDIHISLFRVGHALTFQKCNPGLHHTTQYRIYDLYGVRKYASRASINHCSDCSKQTTKNGFSHLALERARDHIYNSAAQMRSQKCGCG